MFAKYPRAVPGLIGRSDAGIHVVPVAIDDFRSINLHGLLQSLRTAGLDFACYYHDPRTRQLYLGIADEAGPAFDTRLLKWCMDNHIQLLEDRKITFWSGDFNWDLDQVQSAYDFVVMRFMREEAVDWFPIMKASKERYLLEENLARTQEKAAMSGVSI